MTKDVLYPQQIQDWSLGIEIGRGAFSVVCKATHNVTHVVCACKIVSKSNLRTDFDKEQFQREVRAMTVLHHENLVSCHDFCSDDANFYVFLDYCSGGELYDLILRHEELTEPLAAFIFRQIVAAVAYCHAHGVAHRDIKPENILISKFPHVKVSDFGLCGFLNGPEKMTTVCGSLCYCAPECLSRQEYDGRLSDVWSLGVLLFVMITGKHPWNSPNRSGVIRQILKGQFTISPDINLKCKELIEGMMQVDVTKRFTIEQVLEHPWLQAAQKSKYGIQASSSVGAFQMSNRPERNFTQIFNESPKKHSDDGEIFSASHQDQNVPTKPPIKTKSLSFEQVKRERANSLKCRFDPNLRPKCSIAQSIAVAHLRRRSQTSRAVDDKI